MNTQEISAGYLRLRAGLTALDERVRYLEVAVARGDPRFARAEFANHDFDCDAFDRWWASKDKRVPPLDEVFG